MTVEVWMFWRRGGRDVSESSRKTPDRIGIGTPCERRSLTLMWVQIWAEVVPDCNLLHSAAPIRGVATANIEVQIISANVPKLKIQSETSWITLSWLFSRILRYRIQFSQFSSVFHNEWLTGHHFFLHYSCWLLRSYYWSTSTSLLHIVIFIIFPPNLTLLKTGTREETVKVEILFLAVRIKHQAKRFTTKLQIHSWTQTAEIRELQRLQGEWTIKAEWRSVLTCVGVWLCASWVKRCLKGHLTFLEHSTHTPEPWRMSCYVERYPPTH